VVILGTIRSFTALTNNKVLKVSQISVGSVRYLPLRNNFISTFKFANFTTSVPVANFTISVPVLINFQVVLTVFLEFKICSSKYVFLLLIMSL
jgi:hypothetical protein